jgi:hypothetical protein
MRNVFLKCGFLFRISRHKLILVGRNINNKRSLRASQKNTSEPAQVNFNRKTEKTNARSMQHNKTYEREASNTKEHLGARGASQKNTSEL